MIAHISSKNWCSVRWNHEIQWNCIYFLNHMKDSGIDTGQGGGGCCYRIAFLFTSDPSLELKYKVNSVFFYNPTYTF